MTRTTKVIIGVGLAATGLAIAAGGIVIANDDDDRSDVPITGEAFERASKVALEHLGEGRVTGTEVGDEDSYYEVEVTLESGAQVDVQLDRAFNVVGSENDQDTDD
jgi:hypothetical protein